MQFIISIVLWNRLPNYCSL